MFNKTIKYLLILTTFITLVMAYVVFSTNFNGKFRILIFQNNENIVTKCNIFATNVLFQEKPLNKLQKSFQTNEFGCYKQMNLKIETSVKKNDTLTIVFKDSHGAKIINSQKEIVSHDSNETIIPINKFHNGIISKAEFMLMSSTSVFASRILILLLIIGFLAKILWSRKARSN